MVKHAREHLRKRHKVRAEHRAKQTNKKNDPPSKRKLKTKPKPKRTETNETDETKPKPKRNERNERVRREEKTQINGNTKNKKEKPNNTKRRGGDGEGICNEKKSLDENQIRRKNTARNIDTTSIHTQLL